MSLLDESVARELLQPYLSDISHSVLRGWDDWLVSTECARSRYPRTRACIVWERIISHARHRLAQHSRIHAVERHESVSFFFHDRILLRFKKGDAAGFSRNVSTQMALKYHDPQATLFGEHARLEVVYSLNALQTRVLDIQIVCRNGATIAWAFSIMPSADVHGMPGGGNESAPAPADELVEVKTPASTRRPLSSA